MCIIVAHLLLVAGGMEIGNSVRSWVFNANGEVEMANEEKGKKKEKRKKKKKKKKNNNKQQHNNNINN